MKKKILALFLGLLFLLGGCAVTNRNKKDGTVRIAASFYPVWVMAANVLDGVEGTELFLLTAPDTGCLHNYQLQPGDMKNLAKADLLLVNGAGMEPFLDSITEAYPDLPVADTSEGIELIRDGEETNPHIWLDPEKAVKQVQTLTAACKTLLPEKADQLDANAEAYIGRLTALKEELTEKLADVKMRKLITSHDAFVYFAEAYGLEIAAVIQDDEEAEPSARRIEEICALMKEEKLPALFTEPDTRSNAPKAISTETGAKIVVLDPMTAGTMSKEAYEVTQRANAALIAEAYQ